MSLVKRQTMQMPLIVAYGCSCEQRDKVPRASDPLTQTSPSAQVEEEPLGQAFAIWDCRSEEMMRVRTTEEVFCFECRVSVEVLAVRQTLACTETSGLAQVVVRIQLRCIASCDKLPRHVGVQQEQRSMHALSVAQTLHA